MSDITLRVKAEFEQAQKAFLDLANSSDEVKKKIEKFSDSFKTENINKFIDRQKLLEISLQGTRGETKAMQQAANNYGKEIERLIKSGLSPESDAIQRLAVEQSNLKNKIDENNSIQKVQTSLMNSAAIATQACFEAIGAGIVALGMATQKTAEMGAQIEDTSKKIGMTAETFQELDYAAKLTGVNNLGKNLEKLNKSMVDVGNGTGVLTKYLKDNDKRLLTQLKNVNSNEEAFMLLMDAINKTPDGFSKAELAMAAFGKSGQDMILMAEDGIEGIKALGDEARNYGIMSNEAVIQSGLFMDAQDKLTQSVQGVGIELTERLMPGLTDTITKIADFITNIDDWEGVLINAGIAVGTVTAALTTFIAVSKGHAIITLMAGAVKGLMIALTGPAGIAALAIGGLAAGIGLLIKRQHDLNGAEARALENIKQTKEKADLLLSAYTGLNAGKVVDEETSTRLIKLYPELNGVIDTATATAEDYAKALQDINTNKTIEAEQKRIDELREYQRVLRVIIQQLDEAKAGRQKVISGGISEDDPILSLNADAIKQYTREAEEYTNKIFDLQDNINKVLNTVGKGLSLSEVGGGIIDIPVTVTPEIKDIETPNKPEVTVTPIVEIKPDEIKTEIIEKSLQERLKNLNSGQLQEEEINQIQSYLQQRADLETDASDKRITLQQNELNEKLNAENTTNEDIKALYAQRAELEQTAINERIKAIQDEAALILESDTINEDEKLNAKIARDELINELNIEAANKKITVENEANEAINQSNKKSAELQELIFEQKKNSIMTFVNGIGQLLDALGEKNKAFAIAGKAIAMVEAGINTALAATKALASAPPPFNFVAMAGVIAAGVAQQIKIGQSMIPSAETGGRFIVPNNTGVDSQIMRVNPGEQIDVIPRGMTGQDDSFHFSFNFEGSQFASIINKLAKRGELYQLQLAGNL